MEDWIVQVRRNIALTKYMTCLISFLQHAIAKIKVPAVDQHVPVHLGTVEHCVTLHVHQCAHKAINYKTANAVCKTYTCIYIPSYKFFNCMQPNDCFNTKVVFFVLFFVF